MSDLQCPATFLVLRPSGATASARVAGIRLAAAYAAPEGRAVAARGSGLTVATLAGDTTLTPRRGRGPRVRRGQRRVERPYLDQCVRGVKCA